MAQILAIMPKALTFSLGVQGLALPQERKMNAVPVIEIVQIFLACIIALPCVGLALVGMARRQPNS